jgi:hypothetical protein
MASSLGNPPFGQNPARHCSGRLHRSFADCTSVTLRCLAGSGAELADRHGKLGESGRDRGRDAAAQTHEDAKADNFAQQAALLMLKCSAPG